jgi:hypothetical protein
MKKVFGLGLISFFSFTILGCEMAVRPGHPGFVISPPPPPMVRISVRPSLVFLADYGIHVAADLDYYIFYDGSFWFYFTNDHWFRGRNYDGPWVFVERDLPPGLRRVPPGHLKKLAKKIAGNFDKPILLLLFLS